MFQENDGHPGIAPEPTSNLAWQIPRIAFIALIVMVAVWYAAGSVFDWLGEPFLRR
jgi:hypothetical protein